MEQIFVLVKIHLGFLTITYKKIHLKKGLSTCLHNTNSNNPILLAPTSQQKANVFQDLASTSITPAAREIIQFIQHSQIKISPSLTWCNQQHLTTSQQSHPGYKQSNNLIQNKTPDN